MPQVFTPPTVDDVPWVNTQTRGLARRLFRYYGPAPRGHSVIKAAGVYRIVDTPDQLTLEGLVLGLDYFIGGHIYPVSEEVADDLIADGFGDSLHDYGTWGSLSVFTWSQAADYPWEATP